jgi:hypothetical protein
MRTSIQELGLTWGIFQVPVIAVFTKYDQFRLDLRMELEDENRHSALAGAEMERILNEHYLASLNGPPPFVCLESEAPVNQIAFITLISVLQECTSLADRVLISLK